MIKAIAITLLLSGCSTAVQVHEPVNCLSIPNHAVTFTKQERVVIKSIVIGDGRLIEKKDGDERESILDKFEQIATIYKQRIITNCELVESHNKLHEVEK